MKLLQQKYAFQEPQNLVLNSFSCPHKDATLTVQEHASVVTQKSVINRSKKLKIRYIRFKKNSLYPDFPKSIFNRLGVFRSVRHLEVHTHMRSSDAACCAILGVNTCFFSLRVRQPSYRASRSPKTWYITHNLVPMRLPKTAHLIMMASKFFSSSKMSKTGKNEKIRYISVIT